MQSPTPFHEHVATVAGTRLHCAEAGNGELLVLIHGSLCDYRYWRWQMPQFSTHFHVVAPSLPGCWPEALGSAAPDGVSGEAKRKIVLEDSRYSLERHIQSIVEFCQHTAAGRPVHLLGHSRGAQVALEAAMAMPTQVKRLILADPGFPFSHEPAVEPVHVAIARQLGLAPTDEVIGRFVDAVNGPDTWRRTVSWFKDMVRDNAWTLLAQVNDIYRAVDAGAIGRLLHCPVLLVGGEHSPPRYGSRIEALLHSLPQARRVVVPRAAHGMNLANARYFNDAVLQFLLQDEGG